MKTSYSISIPKPCHENWLEMTPNQKGRFCQTCSKTVVDFTTMKTNQIQEFIHENKGERICGHINQTQLDTINFQISETVFEQAMSFHKLFLLALLLAMGTSLFSCADDKGNIKKIESIEIVEKVMDSTKIEMIKYSDSSMTHSSKAKMDCVIVKKPNAPIPVPKPPFPTLDGLIIVTGDIEEQVQRPIHPDSIVDPQYPEIIEGEMGIEEIPHCPGPERKSTDPYNYNEVEVPPMFHDTPENLDPIAKKKYFQKRISTLVNSNLNIEPSEDWDVTRIYRITVQFKIDKKGNPQDIKSRAIYPFFEKEAKRVIQLLPRFIPAKNKGEVVDVIYNLPIIFNIED